ncbi:MAG: helix-turn-helix transcriptional regulator [Duncaniella sp.]|uniref:helix-turn-helix domain-containing protein n=1 Tax=Duncaniella sp. TaxID=2518496 RepID=UPI0023BE77FC|nr:helix-turn-helix transcriptional regulator [Duncaniella sp.]MDE6090838.1 helix-turn-helix transcriptional regulator [Duncaniella sp.]
MIPTRQIVIIRVRLLPIFRFSDPENKNRITILATNIHIRYFCGPIYQKPKSNFMMHPSNDSHPNTPNLEMISDIISRVSNLFYETMFVVDVNDGSLAYFSPKSGLAKIILAEESGIPDLSQLTYILGKVKTDNFQLILKAIRQYCNKVDPGQHKNLLFISDTPLHISNLRHSTFTVKFTPFSEDGNGSLKYLLCSLSLSSGTHPETLQTLNTITSERDYYDFSTKNWKRFCSTLLSEIERHVLSLSAEGLSVPEISEIVWRAQDSVKSIRKRIFEKLGVANITEAIIYATNYKII